MARQRWHREYIALFCDSVPVCIIASPTGTLEVRCCAAKAKRGSERARLRGERTAILFEHGIKKSKSWPHQIDCPVGWVRQIEAAEGPDLFPRRLGHLIRGGWVRHGTMCLGHGRCRSVLRLYGGQILEAHGAACQKMGALSFGGSKKEQTRYVFADFGSFL